MFYLHKQFTMKKLKLLLLFIVIISIKSAFAQQNRLFNSDTIFYSGNKWNTKIYNQLIPFDSTLLIVKFNEESNQDNIINYLQSHQIELIDSLYDYKLCRLNSAITLSRSIDSLTSSDYFEYAELNISGIVNTVDSLFRNQLHLNPTNFISSLNLTNNQNLDSAWHYTYGNKNIIVAVIDAYPDWSHEDIGMGNDGHENVWKNPGEDIWSDPNDPTTGDSIDNDGNGLIDDWKGWDFFTGTNDVRPRTIYDIHGTQVSGVIGAKTNNTIGGAGIAGGNYLLSNGKEGVQLMTINICTSNIDGSAKSTYSIWNLVEAIDYAAKHKAKIISLSLSTGRTDDISCLKKIIAKAKHNYNCTIFCSSGNNLNNDVIEYPSSDENVYSVGAVDIYGRVNKYNLGKYTLNKKMDFVAYAGDDDIVTTSVNNTYVSNFGQTSAASPQASGVAALLYSYIPCANDEIIYDVMKITANKLGIPDSFIYENNTNSNRYGYGIPDATEAMLLLKSYVISNHHITTNTTWTTPKISTADINIISGNTLTIKSTLIMAENTKIIVEAGANLVIDSGTVTSTCGWKGIEVYGLATNEQNSSTFGEVFVKNKGKIEAAWIGIHSIYGGIIHSTDSAIFRNNDKAILMEKYEYSNLLTEINYTKFIADAPFLPSYNASLGTIQGVHSFIKTIDVYSLYISNCDFTNTYDKNLYDNGIAVHAMNANGIYIYNSTFSGMYRSIEVSGLGGLVNNIYVKNCSFSNVLQGIRVVNMKTQIEQNTFDLAYVGKQFYPIYNVHGSFGIYAHSCVNDISNNTFNTENGKSYGVILRNSRSHSTSVVHHNIFTRLKYGTQIEQSNKTLTVFCNEYSYISANAWSVNPFYVGSGYFPMQGVLSSTLQPGERRAGNLFFDRELTNGLQRHIRTSVDFIYNAANNPIYALPEYKSSILTIGEFEENNNTSCEDSGEFFIYCGENICDVSQLLYLLSNTENVDSIAIYKQEILKSLVINNQFDDAYDRLVEWNDNAETKELLFQTCLNLKKYTSAQSLLSTMDTTTDRDLDFFHLYSIILNQYQNGLNRDSLTTVQLALMEDIAGRTNDVSDLTKAYLNFYKNGEYLMLPEEWEEESARPINIISSPQIEPLTNTKTNSFSYSLFPNPSHSETNIHIYTENTKSTFNLEIINAIGNRQMEFSNLLPNEKVKLNTLGLTAGVYTIKVSDENNAVINKRLVILR